jgi:hypothetical protein
MSQPLPFRFFASGQLSAFAEAGKTERLPKKGMKAEKGMKGNAGGKPRKPH